METVANIIMTKPYKRTDEKRNTYTIDLIMVIKFVYFDNSFDKFPSQQLLFKLQNGSSGTLYCSNWICSVFLSAG